MKVIGGFEDLGEAAHEAGQAIGDSAKQQTKAFAKATTSQVTGNQSLTNTSNQQDPNEQAAGGQKQMSDDQAKQFLKDLYGPSNVGQDKSLTAQQSSSQNTTQATVTQAMGIPQSDPSKGKTPEELAKISGLRKQLHADYYESLTKPVHQEEHVAEKLEREEQEKQMADLEKKDKQPQDLPATVKQGTGETVVGVSG